MLISIIIPVFNNQKHLKRCLDSVLVQTYKNIEVILIDDGSTDNSGEICDDYASKDKRIKVFHTINQGVSIARNLGLDNATGEYIMFVDSDDWIEKNTLECVYNNLKKYSYDCLLFGFIIEKNKSRNNVMISKQDVCYNNRSEIISVLPELILNEYINPLWNKVYKKSIIENMNLRFDKTIHLGEDLLFNFNYFKQVH